jgi:hypothetical protein
MLRVEGKRLRWWGLDMRPRWIRRVAVVGTYFVLFVLMVAVTMDHWPGHPYLTLAAMVGSTMICKEVSIFRRNGVVKSFEDLPMRAGAKGMVLVNGLDEWARYRFGVASFEEASEEQRAELLKRYRVGTFAVPIKPTPWTELDEREIGERDDASRWALQRIVYFLALYAGLVAVQSKPLTQIEAAGFLWSFSLLAQTLPQARVLWMEGDPRELSGGIELVGTGA